METKLPEGRCAQLLEFPSYVIYADGRIYSLYRNIFLRPIDNGHDYLYATLRENNTTQHKYIHRLVALTFIPNPNNLSDINHKDENKQNNSIENLEWVSHRENCQYGTKNIRAAEKNLNCPNTSKPIQCLETKEIFPSEAEAARQLNLHACSICNVLKSRQQTTGGYHFQYYHYEK